MQLAIYDRVGIFALFERSVTDISGVKQLSRRPKSHAFKGSHFAGIQGFYYEIDELSSLGALISKYLNISETSMQEASIFYARFEDEVAKSFADAVENRRGRLRCAPAMPRKVKVSTTVFLRNADVVAEVLHLANGICAGCTKQAPFNRRGSGEPYLKVHQRKPLAQGGDDTVNNAIALCPNCHQLRHYG